MADRRDKKAKTFRLPTEIVELKEFNRRKVIWTKYYELVKDTRAYFLYQDMHEEFKRILHLIGKDEKFNINDHLKFKELYEESRRTKLDGTMFVTVPPFGDPEIEMRKHKLGVREWLLGVLDPEKETDRSIIMQINNRFDEEMSKYGAIFNGGND